MRPRYFPARWRSSPPSSRARRGPAIGIWGATVSAAIALGPLGGGVLVEGLSWRAIFLVGLVLAIPTAVTAVRHVRESRALDAPALDIAGTVALTTAMFLSVFALLEGNQLGWGLDPGAAPPHRAPTRHRAGRVLPAETARRPQKAKNPLQEAGFAQAAERIEPSTFCMASSRWVFHWPAKCLQTNDFRQAGPRAGVPRIVRRYRGFRQGTDNERSLALGGSAGSRVAVESASASRVREPDSCWSSRRRPRRTNTAAYRGRGSTSACPQEQQRRASRFSAGRHLCLVHSGSCCGRQVRRSHTRP